MGIYVEVNGVFGPSKSWLRDHPDFVYDPDEFGDDAYDVEDDEEALKCLRTCRQCGCSMTLWETLDYYYRSGHEGFKSKIYDYDGNLCWGCLESIILN